MSCAACSARVEKSVSALEGVTKCAVNLLTASMTVEGNADDKTIIDAVVKAGYSASPADTKNTQTKTKEKNDLKPVFLRLIFSVLLLIPLMYISMGHSMMNFPVPEAINNETSLAIIQMLLAALVMVINQKFFINGFKGIFHAAANMDTLVALGSASSFIYSVCVLLSHTSGMSQSTSHDYYFESAAMILTLITVGKLLEAYSKNRTTDAVKSLMEMAPDTATVIINGQETEIDASTLSIGDIFLLRPGNRIPADGVITEGALSIDESMLTGESIPVDKTVGDKVSGGSIALEGYVKCKAVGVGEDTAIAKIIKTVNEAASSKAPISKKADAVAGVFVPVVIGVSLITLVIWLIIGKSLSFALTKAVAVLVISCPCSLGLATPVAVMVGSGMSAKHGILFKSAEMLEEAGKINTVVFDKTGTLTKGEMSVANVFAYSISEEELISGAYSLEVKSAHPLSNAICSYAKSIGAAKHESREFSSVAGKGIKAVICGKEWTGASLKHTQSFSQIPEEILEKSKEFANNGQTPILFTVNKNVVGIIAVADTLKDDAVETVEELKSLGITPVMLTGDNAVVANNIANKLNIDKVYSEVLPEGKEKIIKELMKNGKVAMVGDGVNDAPALTRANIGIAVGAGTDVAIDSADIVLTKKTVKDVASAIKLSRRTLTNIKENLFWAFLYNSVGIPIAAGVLFIPFGIELNPMIAAAAMSLSSFCVVMNALRLNTYKFYSSHKTKENNDDSNKIQVKEKKTMNKTVKVEGMMCPHCEARVKKALENIPEIETAVASHERGTVTITLKKDLSDEIIKETIEKEGYRVI